MGAAAARREAERVRDRPDIFVIVMDSVRADRLGCSGYAGADTRSLDEFARQGTLYTQAIAPGYWTLPSHGSLFTGLYPVEHGATRVGGSLPAAAGTTMAEGLARAGYHTAAISNNPNVSAPLGFDRGFEVFVDAWRQQRVSPRLRRLRQAARALGHGDTGAAETNARVRRILQEQRGPLFCFVLYMETHAPYRPLWTSLRRAVTAPYMVARMLPVYRRIASDGGQWGPALREHSHLYGLVSDLYDRELSYLDRRIGDLLDDIHSLGRPDESVIVVTADHGECLGQHGIASHGACLYDALLHVPLLIRRPGDAGGKTVDAQVQLNDIWPSLARLLELPDPAPHHSARRPDVLRCTEDASPGEPAFAQTAGDPDLTAVRADGHKYIRGQQEELYSLSDDPGEEKNIGSQEPERVRKLRAILEDWERSLIPFSGEAAAAVHDEALAAHLRALGYM